MFGKQQIRAEGPMACAKGDLRGVIGLVDSVMRTDSDQTMLEDYPLVYEDGNLENIRIIKAEGEVVSVVPFIPRPVEMDGARFKAGIISPTATHPEHRKKGYALKCLKSCIEKMESSGVDISVLWTRVPTFRFYEHADYQAVKRNNFVYRCRPEDAGMFKDHGGRVVEYNQESRRYIGDIQRMHENEVCGIFRTGRQYPVIFSLPKMKTRIVLNNGIPEAYLTVSRAVHRPGIVEGGGEARGLETLMHFILSESSGETLVHDYPVETALGGVMKRNLPGRRETAEKHMMARINNVHSFFRNISPWLAGKKKRGSEGFSVGLKDTGETISFRFTGEGIETGSTRMPEHEELTRRELASVVFGPHEQRRVEMPEALKDISPVYFPIWQLDHS